MHTYHDAIPLPCWSPSSLPNSPRFGFQDTYILLFSFGPPSLEISSLTIISLLITFPLCVCVFICTHIFMYTHMYINLDLGSASVGKHVTLVFLRRPSPMIMPSSVCFPVSVIISFLFTAEWNSMCTHDRFFHPFIGWWASSLVSYLGYAD